MKQTSHSIGKDAESACCDYLKQQGLKLITQNYHGYRGEIDLIMRDQDCVVFVEVRFRKNAGYGDGFDSVTHSKKQRILATAEQYLQQETSLKNGRIDVVAMSTKPEDNEYQFEWIRNAF